MLDHLISYLTNLPFLLGLAMLAVVGYMIWRKPGDAQPITVMFLAGVALIVLSDDRISLLKFSSGGLEITRQEVKDKVEKVQIDYAEQIAKINSELAQQKKDAEEQKRIVQALSKQGGATAPAIALDTGKAAADKAFAENAKYSTLVYFRDSADRAASDVVAKLVQAGFKSAKVNTDLTEVGRVLPSGSIRIRYNEGLDAVAKRVFETLQAQGNVAVDPRATARQIPGDVQILLY